MKRIAILAVCIFAAAANAGVWTVTKNADPASIMLTDGALVKASNLGLDAAAQTIGSISYDIAHSNITGADPASNSWASKFYSGSDPAMSNLLNSGGKVSIYNPKNMNITFSGLTVGDDYRFQLILGGAWGGCAANLYGDTTGASDYKYVYFGDGNTTRLATYTFTAASDTVIINTNAGNGQANHFNLAYALHNTSVPEPATMLLLALGSLAALKRRK